MTSKSNTNLRGNYRAVLKKFGIVSITCQKYFLRVSKGQSSLLKVTTRVSSMLLSYFMIEVISACLEVTRIWGLIWHPSFSRLTDNSYNRSRALRKEIMKTVFLIHLHDCNLKKILDRAKLHTLHRMRFKAAVENIAKKFSSLQKTEK